MLRFFLIINIILCLWLPLTGELAPSAFVDIGYGARASGMSNAFTGVADDASAIVWNPAGLVQIKKREIFGMHANQKNLISYDFAAAAIPFKGGAVLGAGIIHSGDLALTEITGMVSFAQTLTEIPKIGNLPKGINIGVTYKIRSADFGNNTDGGPDRVTGDANGYGFDFGLLYGFSEKSALGISIRDFYSSLYWDTSTSGRYEESVPMQYVMGISYRNPDSGLIVSFDFDSYGKVRTGFEDVIGKIIALRAGIKLDTKESFEQKNEYSVGVGIYHFNLGLLDFSFDASYSIEKIADTIKFSSSIRF